MTISAWLYDGQTALRHEVTCTMTADCLHVYLPDGKQEAVMLSELFWLDSREMDEIFGRTGVTGWRLGIRPPVPDALLALRAATGRYGGLIDRLGLMKAVIGFAGLSLALIYAVMLLPDVIAPRIPYSWEQRFGAGMMGDLGNRLCKDPHGQAALDALARKISHTKPHPRLHIANLPMVNAVTLPGGQILIFRGLLEQAESPDELAGVIGHELGHVTHRDVMTALTRQFGLSLLASGFNGQAGGAFNLLLSARYSQDAEARADAYARQMLARAHISPLPTAKFFGKMGVDGIGTRGKLRDYLASHPSSLSRASLFRASYSAKSRYQIALTPAQWRAIVDSCAAQGKPLPFLPF